MEEELWIEKSHSDDFSSSWDEENLGLWKVAKAPFFRKLQVITKWVELKSHTNWVWWGKIYDFYSSSASSAMKELTRFRDFRSSKSGYVQIYPEVGRGRAPSSYIFWKFY